MKLSNIRIENFIEKGHEKTRLVCDVENCPFSQSKQIYYVVPSEFRSWLADDVYDSFMVALLFPIMRNNDVLEIDGNVSKRIHLNLMYEVAASLKDFEPSLFMPTIRVKGYADAKKIEKQHVGVGFAAGVDSFAVLHDHYWYPIDEDKKIDTLFSFHVDNYGDPCDPASSERAEKWYRILTKGYADKIGGELLTCFEDSNIFEFHPPMGTDLLDGFLVRLSMALSLQRGLSCFYCATDLSYGQSLVVYDSFKYRPKWMHFWEYVSSSYVCPLLSNKGLEFISDGSRYKRGDKIELIINDPYVKEFFNVCTCSSDTDLETNCSHCRKCKLTMLALDILGKLDDFKDVFDVNYFRKHKYGIKCHAVYNNAKEEYSMVDVELAKKHKYPMPSKFSASLHIFANKLFCVLGLAKIRNLILK